MRRTLFAGALAVSGIIFIVAGAMRGRDGNCIYEGDKKYVWSVSELVKVIKKTRDKTRLWVQIVFTAVTNGYLIGFVQGKIYTGPTKNLCVPGLNCYSCPGALGSCPIGSLQAVLGEPRL